MKRSVAAVLAVVLAGIVAGLVLILAQREPRLAGSGTVAPAAFIGDVEPGGTTCMTVAAVPGGTARMRALIGTYGAPAARLSAELTAAGRVVASAPATDHRTGITDFVLEPPLRRDVATVRVCIANEGAAKVAVAGAPSANPKLPGTPSFTWYRAGEQSGAALVPKVAQRAGAGRGAGSAWLVLAFVLLVGAGVGALVWVARGVRE
ncbi:unannotated protein [freshwater metagenome]|uniref:Unannotated protein n=1 Tax=freshwater metagenome TaxID=449393 RepID=A0A6J7HSY6_9ZZZZ